MELIFTYFMFNNLERKGATMKIEELHKILYDILCEIEKACQKEHVQYMLGGGTMLGAVRHKGFIPWDDDADICVWYSDYPAMRDALRAHLPEHLCLIEPMDLAPNFYDFVYRVVDTRYYWHSPTVEDEFYDNKQNHVCVDIFVVANGADSLKGINILAFKQKVLYGLAMGHRYPKPVEGTLLFRIIHKLLFFIGKKISMNKILKWQDAMFKKYSKSESEYCVITNDIPKYLGLPYRSSWFRGVVYMPFEETMVPFQNGYHEKLSLQYGDYMNPPSNRDEYIQHMQCE